VFQADQHINEGVDSPWHYVWITNPSGDGNHFVWNNKAGHSWNLDAHKDSLRNIVSLSTDIDCPYYEAPYNHTDVEVIMKENTAFTIGQLVGPFGEIYYSHDFWSSEPT